MSYLSSEIQKKYEEKDKAAKYDNLFRVNMAGKNYDVALSQLDSVRSVYKKSNPSIAHAMGTQYEIFIKAKKNKNSQTDFQQAYKEEFKKKYESLPVKSQIILTRYFSGDTEKTKKDLLASLKNDVQNKDSIDLKKAILLCRSYNAYIAGPTFDIALKYLKDLDSRNFEVMDSLLIDNQISIRVVLNKKITHPESTILTNSIYPDNEDVNDQKQQASYGYHSVYIYPRGKYTSNSAIEPFEHEQEDINKVIDWVIKQPWSNGKTGMIGGSYLGFSQWAAAKNIHPALKTIIPQASVGIGTVDFPMNNNIFASYCLRWINYVTNNKMLDQGFVDEDKWHSVFKKWYESGEAFNRLDSIAGKKSEIFQRWLKHPSFDNYWQKMIPYKREYSNINIPVLTITGYYDSDQLGALYYLRNHFKYNKNAYHYVIIGPYDHSGAQGYIKSNVKGYTIDPAANIDLGNMTMEWFDYILKGKAKPSFLKDKINYQVMGANEWKSTSNIDDFDKNKLKFYITSQHQLSLQKEAHKDFTSIKVDLKQRSNAAELLKQNDNVIDTQINHPDAVVFSSDPFDKPFEYSGNFRGRLKLSVNKKDVDVYMKLYEKTQEGKYFLLSTYYGRASYAKSSEKRKLLRENKETDITAVNNEFVSKKVAKGSTLVLVLGVIKNPLMQINYGTGKDVSEETIKDAAVPVEIKFYNNSFIEIPISLK
ncbi:CocE/NonD family hydrolase [Chryseobacterium sp. KLBC 52]|uniref:CocE/NonD family hydrolase n=1 Tax=Chryseobacterium sp. KLBC 52 TaxID=1862702 RepID=UPI001E5578E1|nr:CocE/NonD family hydrolase [Chryseobacterium sp. KLBC 52]